MVTPELTSGTRKYTPRGPTNPLFTKLTEEERWAIGYCYWYSLNSKRWTMRNKYTITKIAAVYGVSRKTVHNCYNRYFGPNVESNAEAES